MEERFAPNSAVKGVSLCPEAAGDESSLESKSLLIFHFVIVQFPWDRLLEPCRSTQHHVTIKNIQFYSIHIPFDPRTI